MKLPLAHQRWIYATLAAVYATGVAWMVLRFGVNGDRVLENGWEILQSWALRLHGAAAMLTLLAAGTVLAAHVPTGWKLRQNFASGLGMLAALGALAVTGWLLYYAAGEALRAWSSWIHMGVGTAAPLALVWHLVARRRVREAEKEKRRRNRGRRSASSPPPAAPEGTARGGVYHLPRR